MIKIIPRFFLTFCFFAFLVLSSDTSESELLSTDSSSEQFEYAGFKINFDDLEFNLFVAGELEMLSSSKISEVERIGRTKLLKRIAYFTELYEWKGLKKLYDFQQTHHQNLNH
jgi:hypothetical protein